MLFKNYESLILNGQSPLLQQKRKDALDILSAAIDAVQPSRIIKNIFYGTQLNFPSESIDLSSFDHVYVVGFGKASVGMARAVCDSVKVTKGIVITNDSSATIQNDSIEVIIGGHPLPNEGSIHGAEKILNLLEECTENDCVFVLISGGGSSLFCKPRVPLNDLQKTIGLLLRSGANIEELNTIRKHLSAVKGGQLVKYTKATIVSLIISDIVNDPISFIASGPTSPDKTTFSDARELLKRYALWEKTPVSVRSIIENGIAGRIPATLEENDPLFRKVFNFIIANNALACNAALEKAKELGYEVRLLSTSVEGEARVVGRNLIETVNKNLLRRKTVFIASGETTVRVKHDEGIGGRNQELVLSCIEELAGSELILASFATDGIDGNSTAAGALADGYTAKRALEKNLNPTYFLVQNNSTIFFQALHDTLQTGQTETNVMDIQIVIR